MDKVIRNSFLFLVFLAFGYIILSLSIRSNQTSQITKRIKLNTNPIAICGNNTRQDEPLHQGQNVFKANCAACHKINKDFIGPALQNVMSVYTFETFTDYIIRKDLADKHFNQLNKDDKWQGSVCTSSLFNDRDIEPLFAYLSNLGYVY